MHLSGTSTAQRNTAATQTGLDRLLEAIATGDKSALAGLYEATKAQVYGFAMSILKNPADAEDVLQDTYVKIWTASESYRSQGKPMAWIMTIARNLAMSTLREQGKSGELSQEGWLTLAADEPSVTSEERIVLQGAMSALSEQERQIVTLHAVSGLKHSEIAHILGFPLSTVLSKYARAKKKLQIIMEEGNGA